MLRACQTDTDVAPAGAGGSPGANGTAGGSPGFTTTLAKRAVTAAARRTG